MAQNGLLDFLQGASNAAASNLSAPVDGLAWLLRKAGIQVPEAPVGGSDWMAQKGLTVQPQNQLAGLLGESVGGVAPIVAAAKAPQIARGLLQVEANAAAPRTMRSELGAIDLNAKKRLIEDLAAGRTDGTYRLGDVTPGQAQALTKLVNARLPTGPDVLLTPEAFSHIYGGRILKDGFTPEKVADVAEKALERRSRASMDPASRNPYPALVNSDLRDAASGLRYDAVMPLEPTDGAFNLVSIVPDGLPAPKKKPRQR